MISRLLAGLGSAAAVLLSAHAAVSQPKFEPMNVDEVLTVQDVPEAPPSRWIAFSEGSNGQTVSLDRQSIKHLAQGLYVWIRFDNADGQKEKTILQRWSVNCRAWQITTLDSLVYYRKGDTPVSQNLSAKATSIAPDSIGETVGRGYCPKRR